MHETASPEALAGLLQSSYPAALSGVIGIDGIDGVGKTPLARGLQKAIGGTVISLDDFIEKNQGGYVRFLKLSELGHALAGSERPVIVEGVCLLAVLEQMPVQLALLIYVKRIGDHGVWYDKTKYDPEEPVEEILAKYYHGGITQFREEIIRYHAEYRPSQRATIIHLRRAHG